jgi:hypothetical protein
MSWLKGDTMKKEDVDNFEKVETQLKGAYSEITTLSKKNPNDAINKFKLKFVKQILKDANDILKGKYKPFDELKFFNDDDLPTNSDIVFIISQYLNCMEKFRTDNITLYVNWYWKIDGERSDIQTSIPKKLKAK